MGATRALLTHRSADGSVTYFNTVEMATQFMEILLACKPHVLQPSDGEVEERIEAIKPVIKAKVHSARTGVLVQLNGTKRAKRNVAEHCFDKDFRDISNFTAEQRRGKSILARDAFTNPQDPIVSKMEGRLSSERTRFYIGDGVDMSVQTALSGPWEPMRNIAEWATWAESAGEAAEVEMPEKTEGEAADEAATAAIGVAEKSP